MKHVTDEELAIEVQLVREEARRRRWKEARTTLYGVGLLLLLVLGVVVQHYLEVAFVRSVVREELGK